MTKKDLAGAFVCGVIGATITAVIATPVVISYAVDSINHTSNRIADELYLLRHTSYYKTYNKPVPVQLIHDEKTTETTTEE